MIGPVDSNCAQALCKNQRRLALPATADEVGIFFNLSMDRAHYIPVQQSLYYVDSHLVPVADVIRSALQGQGTAFEVEQLYLDGLSVFKSLKRVRLQPQHATSVLVALRLSGIKVSTAE